MATVLITGGAGYAGTALANALAAGHTVIVLDTRTSGALGAVSVIADLTKPDSLKILDTYTIGTAVHLAAVLGGDKERECMEVNFMASYYLLRYLLDHGCRKFVIASSIAASGIANPDFRPLRVPIPDDHPCMDDDGYGFSKYLVEELCRFFCRKHPDADFITIRMASVLRGNDRPEKVKAGPPVDWPYVFTTRLFLDDAVRCFQYAVESKRKAGIRIMNAASQHSAVACPVPELLRSWYGDYADTLDMTHYTQPGHERDSLFAIDRIREETGFIPRHDVL